MRIEDNIYMATDRIIRYAKENNQRTGQALFNLLPAVIGNLVSGTSFDPFHRDLSRAEMIMWFDNHFICEVTGEVVAVFHGERILWEKEY